jgi:hypothetical protein
MQEVQEPLFLEPLGPGTIGVSNGEELCSGIDGVEEELAAGVGSTQTDDSAARPSCANA